MHLIVESRWETYWRGSAETRLASTVVVVSTVMWCLAHTLPTLSTPAATRPSNDEAAGSPFSSATPGWWANAAARPSPKGASVRGGKVESPRLCCRGQAKWVRWEGTLLGDGSRAPALHPSKAWCSLPAMTSRQLRLGVLLLSGRLNPSDMCRLSRALSHAVGDAGWNYAAWFSGNMTRFAVTRSRGAAVADTEESLRLGFFLSLWWQSSAAPR